MILNGIDVRDRQIHTHTVRQSDGKTDMLFILEFVALVNNKYPPDLLYILPATKRIPAGLPLRRCTSTPSTIGKGGGWVVTI